MMDNVKSLHGDTPEDELSPEQLYERLQGAKLVAENLQKQIDLAKIVHSAVATECAARAAKLARYSDRMLDIAADLARCGSYDHKGKNEVILSVIASLLSWSAGAKELPAARDMDDIPF